MRKKLSRLLWVAPVAMLLFAGTASAQSTGTIVGVVNDAATGKPIAGALVIATSKSLQGEQTAVTDARGGYTFIALPPGVYRLQAQLQGFRPAERTDINLRVDFTLRANIAMVPEAVQMEEQVVRTGTAPAVNVGSAEAGTIVSREFLANVPTTRTFEQVATIAPTAQNDGIGVSFAGGTSPENNYIIDGLRVSDPGFGTLGTNLLTNFIDQIDVKVGSFMPEYGYSSSGIINTVTKSGGNEFHGSIWGNLTPGFFTPSTPGTQSPYALASQSTPYRGSYNADFGLEVGGPIVKDKLWFYAGFAPQLQFNARQKYYQQRIACVPGSPCSDDGFQLDQYGNYVMKPIAGTATGYGAGQDRYFAIAKLTWLVNENHNVFASFNTQPTKVYGFINSGSDLANAAGNSTSNSTNVTVNYTGKFFDKHILLEVKGGWYNQNTKSTEAIVGGYSTLTTPRISWRTQQPLDNFVAGFNCPLPGACPVLNYATGGDGIVGNPTNNRYAGSAALTALFDLAGQHQLKGGVQLDYAEYKDTPYYPGGAAIRAFGPVGGLGDLNSRGSNGFQLYRAFGSLDPNNMNVGSTTRSQSWCARVTVDANGNKVCVNPGGKIATDPGTGFSETNTWSNGFFLQDSWTIANVLTLNFGVRLDQQVMTSPTGKLVFPTVNDLDIKNEWAPRVQAIWDFTGTGRGKIQGNWGMYYESVPLDMALRGFGGERQVTGVYQMGTCTGSIDPRTNPAINPLQQCPNVYGNSAGQGPGPNTISLPTAASVRGFGLTSAYYSPVAPDLKGAFTYQFGGGVQYEVLQDLTLGVEYVGRRLGDVIEDMSSDDGANYFIANPSVSKPWQVTGGPYDGATLNPLNAVGNSATLGQNYFVNWPKPVRSYDGFTFTVNKLFSKRWLAQASYTWSSLRGNYSGLFRPEDDQLDPNLSADYDLVSLLGNKTGPLGLNRTNQVKLAGSYSATLSPDITLVPSINFQAFSGVPVSAWGSQELYGTSQAAIIPRGMAGNLDWTFQLDAGAKVVWAISGPYTLQFSMDIFNLLNMQTVQWVAQDFTYDFVTPMQGAQCSSKNAATAKNPIAALEADCPDLPYARTLDGRRISPNLNYGQPTTSSNGRVGAYQLPISARFGVQLSF